VCVWGEQSPLHSFCPPLSFGSGFIVIVPGSSAGWQLYCRSFRTVRYAFRLSFGLSMSLSLPLSLSL